MGLLPSLLGPGPPSRPLHQAQPLAAQNLKRLNPLDIPLLSQDNAEAQICRRADVQSIYAAAIGSLPKSMYALTEAVVDLGIVESASQFRAHLAVIDAAVRHAHY